MQKRIFLYCFFLFSVLGSAQAISGDWHGVLIVSGMELQNTFHFSKTDEGWTGTLDIPQQGAKGLPIQKVVFRKDSLWLKMPNLGVTYSAKLEKDPPTLKGIFKQHGIEIPLDLSRKEIDKPKRPQTPKAPFPYQEEEVVFTNIKDNIQLSGNLSLPNTTKPAPAVILIHGSGPHNRNGELADHKPFLVLADYLTRHGIAVLRYDKRGIEKSEGSYAKATSKDFAEDVKAGLDFLKKHDSIDAQKIGLIGHSEGGLIAPMVASQNAEVAFIVLLAGPGVDGGEILLKQQELILAAQGVADSTIADNKWINSLVFEAMRKYQDTAALRINLQSKLTREIEHRGTSLKPKGESTDLFVETQLNNVLGNPWLHYFIATDPAQFLEKVNCPVLALNGSLDLQVDADQNLPAIEKALTKGGNRNYKVEKIEGLNHQFQHAKTGLINEYAEIEETIAPNVLEIIKKWIQEL